MPPAPDAGDPPGLRAQVMQLFEAFVRLLDEAPAERQHAQFVLQLRELDLLKVHLLSLARTMSRSRVIGRQPSKMDMLHSGGRDTACQLRSSCSLRQRRYWLAATLCGGSYMILMGIGIWGYGFPVYRYHWLLKETV